jgi:cation diffusion facilitator CzcD-associated flavoprotein CzcO
LKTNNAVGSYEFSDFPMVPERYNLQRGQHIPGFVVHQYLSDAAEYFDISRFLQFETKVEAAERNDDRSWTITYFTKADNDDPKPEQIIANKLIVATGLTSEPFIPYIKGKELFEGPILHSRQLKDRADDLAAAQNVVVVGSNKSAWDVCYGVASSGRTAHMVLRPSGGGPSWVWPLRLEPFNTSLSALSRTRFFTLFDPWPFDKSRFLGRIRQFLHQWALGRWITMQFWNTLGKWVRRQNRYDDSYNTMKLTPWYSVYWMGNSLGIHNYESDWFDLAREDKINIHIANVESVSDTTVNLSDEEIKNVNALVCCTGWRAEPPFK